MKVINLISIVVSVILLGIVSQGAWDGLEFLKILIQICFVVGILMNIVYLFKK